MPRINRRASPESLAVALLRDLGYPERPPIDLERLAKKLDAVIVREHSFDDDTSGILLRDGEQSIISVNASHSLNRQQFTIAHEIGHMIMHPGRPLLVEAEVRINMRSKSSDFASAYEEREANAFAASLLMPEEFVQRYFDKLIGKNAPMEQAITSLCKTFAVSAAAMRYRLTNLGLYITD